MNTKLRKILYEGNLTLRSLSLDPWNWILNEGKTLIEETWRFHCSPCFITYAIDSILTPVWNLSGHITSSIEHNNWEVNSHSGSQEMMCLLCEPTSSIAHSQEPVTGSTLSQINLIHTLVPYLFKNLPSIPVSQVSPHFTFSNKNSILYLIAYLPCMLHVPPILLPLICFLSLPISKIQWYFFFLVSGWHLGECRGK